MSNSAAPKKMYKPDTIRAAFAEYFTADETEDGEIRSFCPVCEDPHSSKTPSASLNPERGVWNCLKGNHGGSIYEMVQDLKRERGFDIRSAVMRTKMSDPETSAAQMERLQAGRAAKSGSTPLPSDEKIDQWQQSLMSNKPALKALMDQRGLDRKTIIEWEIGWDGSRYMIPVRDENRELVNVRRYKLNAGVGDKMLNLPGHGSAAIFRPDILRENEEIVITEGEMDCILLNQFGIPAITHTAGAATFRPNWGPLFADKTVFICYDADDAGRKGAKKVEQIVRTFAKDVFIMSIPETSKGADVTDFLHKEGHSRTEFEELMGAAMDSAGVPKVSAPLLFAGEHASLNASMSQDNQRKVLELTVSVAGKQAEPYTAPKLVTATCDQSKGAVCGYCPLSAKNGQMEKELREDDENLFRFVDFGEERRTKLLREITGARCSDRVEFEVDENYHIEELLVQPSVDDRKDDETQQPVRRTVFSVSSNGTVVNRKVRLVGKNVADPKTGKLRFMSWVNEPVEMDIDKFKLTDDDKVMLEKFQPEEHQSPLDKCLEIAADLSENVTHIYGRDLLHVAFDLVWHSVISFKVGDMLVEKGWVEMMAVGDTRTGKSEIARKYATHYHSGVVQSCEGMSFAGLVGGVQQIDGRWHMTWGVIPMNDRRMVVLDEVSGMAEKNVIDQMSSIRSSGIAQITKIAAEETSARTRLAWITNPQDGSMLADNAAAGIGALRTVVPNNEDIARFDFVIAAAKGDVDSKLINRSFSEAHAPEYTSEDCEKLVKWAWSLTRNDVVVSQKAADQAVKSALDIGERYISDPPLIQAENVRYKLLRIAAAIAARTFSIDKRGRLLVNREHVVDAVRFLDMVYEDDSLGYARASRRAIAAQTRAREKRELITNYLRDHRDNVLLTLRMVGGRNFRTRDFTEFGSMGSDEAKDAVNQLLKWNAVQLKSRGDIGMAPILIQVIRELEDE